MLRDSGASLLLYGSAEPIDGSLPGDPARRTDRPLPDAPPDDAPAVILSPRGTTGRPKGVSLSRAAIRADLDALAEVWQWSPDDRLVHGLPLYHVHGLVLGLLGALRVGCRLTHTGTPTPAR